MGPALSPRTEGTQGPPCLEWIMGSWDLVSGPPFQERVLLVSPERGGTGVEETSRPHRFTPPPAARRAPSPGNCFLGIPGQEVTADPLPSNGLHIKVEGLGARGSEPGGCAASPAFMSACAGMPVGTALLSPPPAQGRLAGGSAASKRSLDWDRQRGRGCMKARVKGEIFPVEMARWITRAGNMTDDTPPER